MSAAVAAIAFALELDDIDDTVQFLEWWNYGEFDKCRKEWPEAPEAVYAGADPMRPETVIDKYATFCKLRDEVTPPLTIGATYYPKYTEREAFEKAIS